MHLGNARTALFNALAVADDAGGGFLLRMEDTDPERSTKAYALQLQEDLHWMGVHWQEGVEIGGPNAPYWQSARREIYSQYYQQLQDQDDAYPCFCTEEQLALSRKIQRGQSIAPRYDGRCANLTKEEVQQKCEAGEKSTLRFRMPKDDTIIFEDIVRGRQEFKTNDIGDFIIRRGDGGASFMFCNAIDDALMGVSLAMRGEDHLTNTPRQLIILKKLDLTAPRYGHISLIVGADGAPLSKRHGSRSIKDLREAGYLSLALINYLARLGHHYADESLLSFDVLAAQFGLTHLGKAPARFDEVQLLHWQKLALATLSDVKAWEWMGEAVHACVPSDKRDLFVSSILPNVKFPAEALAWANLLFQENTLTLDDEKQKVLAAAGPEFFACAATAAEQHGVDYAAICKVIKEKLNVKGKGLFQPLRLVLTGQLHGPELGPLCVLLGKEKLLQRFLRCEEELRKINANL
jgi:glutamyl-tRNA synthetase